MCESVIILKMTTFKRNVSSFFMTSKPEAQLGFFKGRCQISITGHIHFHNFI